MNVADKVRQANAHIAPVLTGAAAADLMCPLLSRIQDGKVERINCQVGECALWDWITRPYFIPGVDDCSGVGKCSIPRKAYAYADAVKQKAANAAAGVKT